VTVSVTDACGTSSGNLVLRVDGDAGTQWSSPSWWCSEPGDQYTAYIVDGVTRYQIEWSDGGCGVPDPDCDCSCYLDWLARFDGMAVTDGDDYGAFYCAWNAGTGDYRVFRTGDIQAYPTATGYSDWECV